MSLTYHEPQDRILAQDVQITLVKENGDPLDTGSDDRYEDMLNETDRFEVQYVPTMRTTQPSGANHPHHQLVSALYRVTIEGGQFGPGYVALGDAQVQAMRAGKGVPKLKMTRIGQTRFGEAFRETYKGGIVTDAVNQQGEGNTALTSRCVIEFEDRQAW